MPVDSRLKAIQIIGQREAFYKQRIIESAFARAEAVDIDILMTSRNGDKKIMQSIRVTSRPPTSISYRKDFNWLNFNNDVSD